MKKLKLWIVLSPLVLAVGACAVEKSENPLSPTVAGPIPGVGISAPGTVEPAQGTKIASTQQPIALVVENATTSGVRPLSYLFEVATDDQFQNKVFFRDGVAPGDGRTSLRLPDALPPGRTYYWHARAGDGANTGPYSNPTVFNIFTPVVIEKPGLLSPINYETVTTLTPTFRIYNAPRSGPAQPITYEIHLATDVGFVNLAAVLTVPEAPGQTALAAPGALASGALYYWRARGSDGTIISPWSDIAAFRTQAVVTPPPGGGGSGGGTTTCKSRSPEDIVRCHRATYPVLLSPAQAPSLLREIALDLNRDRPGYYGRLSKTSGNNCSGVACDIICGTDTHVWDVFSDGPDAGQNYSGSAQPQWVDKGTNASACLVP